MTTERDVLRELESALDVSPSPSFEARVRERVGIQPRHLPRWTWAAVTGVAATMVLAVMLVPGYESPARPESVRLEGSVEIAAEPAATDVVETVRPSVDAGKPTMARPSLRRSMGMGPDVTSPTVIVPAGQMAAVRQLMREVAAGRVVIGPDRPALPTVLQVSALSEAAPIEFDTIRFAPLSVDASPDLWR